MQPIGSPLSANPAGNDTIGPPSAVQGEMYLGSPVQPRPSGDVAGVDGHRNTSAARLLKSVPRMPSISPRSSMYWPGGISSPSRTSAVIFSPTLPAGASSRCFRARPAS
jgi:hypothetical protein